MAKYTVTRSCGHQDVVELFGKHAERERRMKWLAGTPCPSCQQAALGAAAAAAGLPTLTGSERQVAWAMKIRAQMLAKIEENRDEYSRFWNHKYADQCSFDQAIDRLKAKTSASWWIDNRDYNPVNLARDLVLPL